MAEKSRKIQTRRANRQWKDAATGEAIPGSVQQGATPPQKLRKPPGPPLPDSPSQIREPGGARGAPSLDSKGSAGARVGEAAGASGARNEGRTRRRGCRGEGDGVGVCDEVKVLGEPRAAAEARGGRGRGTGCNVSVGLPEAASCCSGKRLLTQAWPPASSAPSQALKPKSPSPPPLQLMAAAPTRLGPASISAFSLSSFRVEVPS